LQPIESKCYHPHRRRVPGDVHREVRALKHLSISRNNDIFDLFCENEKDAVHI